jgi:hypothetical protein
VIGSGRFRRTDPGLKDYLCSTSSLYQKRSILPRTSIAETIDRCGLLHGCLGRPDRMLSLRSLITNHQSPHSGSIISLLIFLTYGIASPLSPPDR